MTSPSKVHKFTSLEKGRSRSCSLGDECRQRKVRISVILKKSSIFQLHIPEEDILLTWGTSGG